MKKIVLVGDGMGDYPVEELGGRTPLQAANIPNIRRIAAAGSVRVVQTVPEGMEPGSDVANLGLLGYDPSENYTGRAPIEAVGAGIPLRPEDVAYRCNLVTIRDGSMEDYSAGHITTAEAHELIESLAPICEGNGRRLHGGVSYRHLLIWRDGPVDIRTQPPHDISGQPIKKYLPKGDRQDEVRDLMEESKAVVAEHPVNVARRKAEKNEVTQIWLWGQGRALFLPTFQQLYSLTGGVISAVDLVRGMGVLAGLQAPIIPGATGFTDTHYEGKVNAALEILEKDDFMYVHIEAPDECGHLGDARLKTEAIEAFDEHVVGPIWDELERRGEEYTLIVCMDHRTPVSVRGHTAEPVPLAILQGPCGRIEEEAPFDETVGNGKAEITSYELIQDMLSG